MKLKEIKENIRKNEDNILASEKVVYADKNIIRKESKLRNFQRLILYIAIIFLILWGLFYFAIGMISAPNEDMRPAFHGGDIVIYDKFSKNPGVNDVIVFEKNGTTYIGRVIAQGGDTVEILETGGIKVNGNAYTENYIYESTLPLTTVDYPLTLEEDEYFVLADSRESAEDSRYFGPVTKVLGKVAGVFRRSGF